MPDQEIQENQIVMSKYVKAGKTILLNTVSNATYIADDLDEKVQTGTRENDKHIEWAGELSIESQINLIAAGPDLLRALEECKKVFDEAEIGATFMENAINRAKDGKR